MFYKSLFINIVQFICIVFSYELMQLSAFYCKFIFKKNKKQIKNCNISTKYIRMSCRITQFEPETKLQPGFCLYVGIAAGGLEVFSIYSHFGSKVTFTKFI